jgi:Dna[CI] antecedent, DciA
MAQKAQALKPILTYPNRTIAQLCLQIDQQSAILARIKAVLPETLANHALHCVLNNNKLLIYTDSANWASQLRFYGKTMLAAIGPASSTPATTIHIKIIDLSTTTKTSPKRMAVIPSFAVSKEIHEQSLITTDPQLKQALDKLSSTFARLQHRE